MGAERYRVGCDGTGELQEHETDDPTALLHELTSEALARGERLAGPQRLAADLEEVYLELTAEPTRRRHERQAIRQPVRGRPSTLGGVAALGWRQYRLERRLFWRNPSAAFFNFLLPLLFLALFGAIFAARRTS